MLAALRNAPDSMSMSSLKDYIDPNLMDLYPHDCLFKVNLTIFWSFWVQLSLHKSSVVSRSCVIATSRQNPSDSFDKLET